METKQTCLHSAHEALGAQMSPFAGYDMPIEYAGLDTEHMAVRNSCGVFDVSHMGEIFISGPQACRFTDYIFTNDAGALANGACAYGMMTRHDGTTVDDLLVYRIDENEFLLIVNAANLAKDNEWIRSHADKFDVTVTDYSDRCSQLAVQGPQAERILKDVLGIDIEGLGFYRFIADGNTMIVSRTGYTGEDGAEIYAADNIIMEMWDKLVKAGVQPCGLGCRDTLRFEAGLPLYGDELTDETTPIEAGLGMFVKLKTDKPFIGREALEKQKAEGVTKKLVGLELEGSATARHGFEVTDKDGNVIGHVTTGYNSLSVGKNIAMAYVDAAHAAPGTELMVKIRRRTVPATVIKKRFYTPNYKK